MRYLIALLRSVSSVTPEPFVLVSVPKFSTCGSPLPATAALILPYCLNLAWPWFCSSCCFTLFLSCSRASSHLCSSSRSLSFAPNSWLFHTQSIHVWLVWLGNGMSDWLTVLLHTCLPLAPARLVGRLCVIKTKSKHDSQTYFQHISLPTFLFPLIFLEFWCRKRHSLDVNHSVFTVVRWKKLFFSHDINETAIKR